MTRITDSEGNEVARFSPRLNEVISGESADKMVYMLKGVVDGSLCTIIINAVNDKVQSITAVEDKSTTDEQLAVDRFNKLVEYYKNNPEYTEFESNDFISPERQTEAKKYITEGWFYAEFFQTTAKQKYTKRMSFRISNEYGDYRIVRHYDKSNEIAL